MISSNRSLLSLLSVCALTANASGQIPKVADPSTANPWGPPSAPAPYHEARVQNAMLGSMYFSQGTTTTRTRTEVKCTSVSPAACGGNPSVSAGASFDFFGITIEIGTEWSKEVENQCWLCQVFLCANFTTTETTAKGKSWRVNGIGQSGPKHDFEDTSSISIPDPSSAALKLACNKTDEAKKFCCPDDNKENDKEKDGGKDGEEKAPDEQGGEDFLGFSSLSSQLTTTPGYFGFGSGQGSGQTIGFTSIGAIVEFDLRAPTLVPGQSWEPEAESPHEWHYVAHTLERVSLAQRQGLALRIVNTLLSESPTSPIFTGHILVAATEDKGIRKVIDLGTISQILSADTLRLSTPADINLDGVVNQADLDIALLDLLAPATYARGDVNLDGWVTTADIDVILAAMGV